MFEEWTRHISAAIDVEKMGLDPFWMQVFIVVFATLVASFFTNRILKTFQFALSKTKTPWDEVVVDAARRPLRTLIWVVGMTFAGKMVHQHFDAALFEAVYPIRDVGVVSCVGWFLMRLVAEGENFYIARQKAARKAVDTTTVDGISKLLRISIMITIGLVIAQTLGFSISGVLAFGGMGGIVMGFAAKDLLANFFGAFTIYFDKPFKKGDWISSPDRDIEGTVERITWRFTVIRTFDKRPLYVPNALFTTIIIQNPSRMSNRRIKQTVGVRYDDMASVGKIVKSVRAYLGKNTDIDQKQVTIVNLDNFGASTVDILVYCLTKTKDWVEFHEVKQKVMLDVAGIIEKHGAEIAFPTSTLHVPEAINILSENTAKKGAKKKAS